MARQLLYTYLALSLPAHSSFLKLLARLGLRGGVTRLCANVIKARMDNLAPQMISTAASLGIPDLLSDGPKTADELARATGTHRDSLKRLLRAMAGAGLLHESSSGYFKQSLFSELLCTGAPGALRFAAIARGQSWWWDTVGQLALAVKSGNTAFELRHQCHFFDYMEKNPESAQGFNDYIRVLSQKRFQVTARGYPFPPNKNFVDIGCGRGDLALEILARNPTCRAVLFDRANVIPDAKSFVRGKAAEERVTFVSGDFLDSVPREGDFYLLSHVIHDWPDSKAQRLLLSIREAMSKDGRLLIIEQLLPPEGTSSYVALSDLNMMVMYGACERTRDDYVLLLAGSGFSVNAIIPLVDLDRFAIIECVPVDMPEVT